MAEKQNDRSSGNEVPPPPDILVQQGEQALHAASAASHDSQQLSGRNQHHHHHHLPHEHHEPPVELPPPPPYDAGNYGQLDISQNGLDTGATIAGDGRVNIEIKEKNKRFTDLMAPFLRRQMTVRDEKKPEPHIPEGLGFTQGLPPPPMNIVIQIVGSRGDVQPFVALGQVLKNQFNHRVRIATHPTFRNFVEENDLEFFSIGGDPSELMAFMVKNPGLMPGMESLRNGDIGKRRKTIWELINGCWRSSIEAGDGTGMQASDDLLENQSIDSAISLGDPSAKPFVADAIIANPVSFAHVHIAEKLGIPLHLMFTMPWSPTQAFPHPLANIISSNTNQDFANFISYALVDMLTWQGLGDLINRFRERALNLEPVSIIWAPNMLSRLQLPWTYCWSPALIPKPPDWSSKIDISGFFFLNLATNYTPPSDLAEFLEAGPPPVYIGFGSIVVDDPNAMTTMIFEAVKKTGQRALVSKGWGGLGADELGIPEGVFMLGNCPHDWLFKRVSCVVHHGGAGTTAAGIAAGRPTVVVPFFGDQPFWGRMTSKAGAGPDPVPYKELTADKLAEAILHALKPESLSKAAELSNKIAQEKGAESGAESFHSHLDVSRLRCSLCPGRVAVWRVRRTDIRLSALAATVLGNEGLIDFSDLKLYRPCEYAVEDGPPEPISGGAAALIGIFSTIGAGVTDMPSGVLKSVKAGQNSRKDKAASGASTPVPSASQAPSISTPSLLSPSEAEKPQSPERPASPSADSGIHGMNEPASESAVSSPGPASPGSDKGADVPRSMASVLEPNGSSKLESDDSSRHRRWSRGGSRSNSGSPSASPLRDKSPVCAAGEEAGRVTLDSAIGTAKATGKILHASMKSPMDFTMSLAQGFHNAPKLYGDTTVRKPEKITDFQSGLKAAGKEFGLGFYDGITGLVTQPMSGAKKEGAAGFVKGMFKGAFGLVLKPGASIWGLPGYTFKGIYMELTKHLGKSVQNYIIAARTAQGYDDWKASGPGERERIVAVWKSTEFEMRRKQKPGRGQKSEAESNKLTPTSSGSSMQLLKGFSNTRHLSFEERKELDKRRQAQKKEEKERKKQAKDKGRTKQDAGSGMNALRNAEDEEFEEAIRQSVSQTSQGDSRQDEMIERALRASVAALRKPAAQSSMETGDDDDEAYQRAVQASIEEAQRVRPRQGKGVSDQHVGEDGQTTGVASNFLQGRSTNPWEAARDEQSDSDVATEDDEDFKRALEESKRAHTLRQKQGRAGVAPPELPARGTGTDTSTGVRQAEEPHEGHGDSYDEEEELRKALAASMQQQPATVNNTGHTAGGETVHGEDDELHRAITASEEENKRRQQELEKQKTEEEIVMEYVKKQSLLEEENRQRASKGQEPKQGESSSGAA